MSAAGPSTVSLILPVCQGGEPFRRCLESVSALAPPPTEIIVVADGDGDGAWRLAEAVGARVVHLATRGGPARARNHGAAAARGAILLFLDADVTAPPDLIARISSEFAAHPPLAAVFGSYDAEPGGPNFLSQFRDLLHHFVHQTSLAEASTFWGACGAIRTAIFRSVGGFDERYREPSIEDIELGYRVKRAGYEIRLCRSLQVKHWKRWTAPAIIRTDVFHRAQPWTRLLVRERTVLNDLNLRRAYRLSVVAAYVFTTAVLALVVRWLSAWPPRDVSGDLERDVWLSLAAMAGLTLIVLNAPLYRFFHRVRGWRFATAAVGWHYVHFLCCGLGSLLGLLDVLAGRHIGAARTATPDERR